MSPRRAAVEECLICGDVPCSCFRKTKSRQGSKRAKSVAPADESSVAASPVVPEAQRDTPVQARSMRDRMKAAAAAAPAPVPLRDASRPIGNELPRSLSRTGSLGAVDALPQPPPIPGPDRVLAAALRAVAPILHDDEKERYSVIVSTPYAKADASAQWIGRRHE